MKKWVIGPVLLLAFSGLLNAQEAAPDPVELYRGAVTVDVILGRGVAAGIDFPLDGKPVGDGVFDRMVVLEAFGTIPPEFPLALPDAYVAVSAGRAFVVEIGGPRIVDLMVERSTRLGKLDNGRLPSEIRLARAWSGADERMTFHGIGLVNASVQATVIDDGS